MTMSEQMKKDLKEVLNSYPGVSAAEKVSVLESLANELGGELSQKELLNIELNHAKKIVASRGYVLTKGSLDDRFYLLERVGHQSFPLKLVQEFDREDAAMSRWDNLHR